ncbi:hypothetical protein [Pseudoalteromonas rubra]|uniref:hypothetical protein n=1 Tax=Pseudoalteromonas rubra TaxID=43658 RepID=UPI000F7901AD|nr:hypothetical protein [Pseudoalteromonas rubra]
MVKEDSFNDLLEQKEFDVEHALSLYASSYCTLPAEFIYDEELLAQYEHVIKDCHIYLIGYLPNVIIENIIEQDNELEITFKVANEIKVIKLPIPAEHKLVQLDGHSYLERSDGEKFSISHETLLQFISDSMFFEVKYIGQAYGKDGSRNALDRLKKHETLQKISLKGVPEHHKLSLLLLSVESNNRLVTMLNPRANKQDDGSRIKAGLEKLFDTSEPERISLFEASLIRYFYPDFNKEFKNSFPSTNLKLLQDCYEKDFSAVFSEICIDELPFLLYSESAPATQYHLAKYNLHDDKARKAFFFSSS